ncbi:acyl carrier protein [compost metagenome]
MSAYSEIELLVEGYVMSKTIRRMISEILKIDCQKVDSLSEESSLEELGLDSLKAMQLVVLLEDEYNIQFDEGDLKIMNFNTISQINALLNKYSIIVE